MQIKRIALGGIIMTVIMLSGCNTTVQNFSSREEKSRKQENQSKKAWQKRIPI